MFSKISIFIFMVVVFRAALTNVGGTAAGATVWCWGLGIQVECDQMVVVSRFITF